MSLAGCRNQCETVEMALRAREQDLRVLKEEVARLEADNHALSKELFVVRHQPGWPAAGPVIAPEFAAQTYTLKRVTLGYGTGGYNDDKKPGDEALQVVIEPRDMADDIIKAPGSAQITALEVSPEGIKAPLSSWNIPAEQLRKHWKQGLLSNGYVLVLPWQQPPKTKQVRVVVRFQLSDGRMFEADRDVSVNPGLILLPGPNTPSVNPGLIMVPAPKTPNVIEPVWPDQPEALPLPQQFKPGGIFVPPPGAAPNGPPAGVWQPPSLNGAVELLRPVSLYPARSEGVESEY
jgi:hypothetical protein